ncbi:sensor histidine kinase [Erythrobacteraceae bacterium CFH 75059]|uniref:sensor histidine kinase n=1 Tax=Qipengyuania thermophila TaxID=2509361 RepID=UPI00101FBEFF|nr:histidine kinase dimerization/phospho-acceptor domain-containing protein [Qipengyuania thermophila]TCD04985.1 sensor histidine kinase [Erythrobacteraceae bacterium CFH 75059]
MHIDDRLATVLRQQAESERAARTQFRQLLDLLGDRVEDPLDDLEMAGLARLQELATVLPARDRAALIREGGWRYRNLALLLFLAEQEADVAASALGVVDLPASDWLRLIPELPVRARGFLRLRDDLPASVRDLLDQLGVHDLALPSPDTETVDGHQEQTGADAHEATDERGDAAPRLAPPGGAPAPPPLGAAPDPGADAPDREAGPSSAAGRDDQIRTLLQRIATFQARRAAREERTVDSSAGAAPLTPPPDDSAEAERLSAFDFLTDEDGTITWVSPEARAMLMFLPLGQLLDAGRAPDAASGAPRDVHSLFRQHQPVSGALTLPGERSVGGAWFVDAFPVFDERHGRYRHHLGRARRLGASAADQREERANALRQLLHELRTPVNAIQGYAEMVQQQVAGPAPHAYRAVAASIGSDSARILAGFDDLERLARLEAGATERGGGEAMLDTIVQDTVRRLRPALQAQGSGIDLTLQAGAAVAMPPDEAEMLVWRILSVATAALPPHTVVDVELRHAAGLLMLTCSLPEVLHRAPDPFDLAFQLDAAMIDHGLFGAGFTLRLARLEARSVGGDLCRDGTVLTLTLPAAAQRARL